MGEFECFKEQLMNGNAEGVRENLKGEFVDKVIDDDGHFPIHIACREGFVDVARLLLDNNCNIDCEAKRKWRPIHYASRGGHSEILKLLLDRNCNFECETKSGWRPVHWASSGGHLEILKILLDRNCNIECKTNTGNRPIHCAASGGHSEILKLLLDSNCNFECEANQGERPIHFASWGGHSEILKLLLDCNCNIECETKSGMRPIHWASREGHLNIIKVLLDCNCNIECMTKLKWRPIHYAIKEGHSEILKLLLRKNCRIDCKTKDRKTALDMAKLCSKKDCFDLLINAETVKKLFSIIERNDPIAFEELFKSYDFIKQNIYSGLGVLEIAIESNVDKIIKCILDKPFDDEEINDEIKELTSKEDKNANLMKECILYRCVTHKHMTGFRRFNSAEVINGQRRVIGQSFLELAVEKGCHLFIDLIMRKTVYDRSLWSKAIDKAKEKGFLEIQEEIQERMILMESRQKVNFTILHTAIADNDADMVQYVLNHPNIVDLNTNNEIFGTALALAHSLHHRKCIRVMQSHELDTNTRNKYSETPLHEAIASGLDDNCGYLIDRSIDIDQTGFMGLTGLHCAVIRGMVNVCAQLVNRGADYVRYVEIINRYSGNENEIPFVQSPIISLTCSENALTLSMKFHGTLFPCFADRLDASSSNAHDGDNNSLLHLAVKSLQSNTCISLLNAGAQVNSINNFGNSPLLEMFCETQLAVNDDNLNKLIDITNILIGNGADVNAQSSNGITAFQLAANIGSEKIMLALVSNNPKLINFASTDFQIPFTNQWFEYGEILIKLLPDNFLSSTISNETFQSCESAGTNLIKSIFNKSSSTLQQSVIENLLYKAVNSDNGELFDHLIQTEISAPRSLGNGENLFTFILQERKMEFTWKLLDSVNQGKFVMLRNTKNQIPLQIAIEMEEMDLVNALIIETKEFDSENEGGTCALSQLLEKISISNNANIKRKFILAIKTIISLGGNIYKMTSRGQRIIDVCTDSVAKEEIERSHRNSAKPSNEENKPDNEIAMCYICMDNQVDIVFQCGHLTCDLCSDQLFFCPFCNAEIITRTKLFFS